MRISLGSLSLRTALEVMPKGAAARVYVFTAGRIALNLLDIVGLAALAALVSGLAAIGSEGKASLPFVSFWLDQDLALSDKYVLVAAACIAGLFVIKSALSVWLKLRTSFFLARLETEVSKLLTEEYFLRNDEKLAETLPKFQNLSISSTSGLTLFINSRITFIAESTLLIALAAILFVINPLAALVSAVFAGLVLAALTQIVTKKIKKNGLRKFESSQESLALSRDLFNSRREARASGAITNWIERFVITRSTSAKSSAAIYNLMGLPRYVIETSLVVGACAFLLGAVTFSSLQAEAATIAVFMVAGLRLVALLVPLQASISSMADGGIQGQFALDALKKITDAGNVIRSPVLTPLVPDGGALGLEMHGVKFGYDQKNMVLENISISVEPGQKVALVGPSGAGKSTCFELATGFRVPQAGEVWLGGETARHVLDGGTGVIGIVPQRPHLVLGTLSENVSMVDASQTNNTQVMSCLKMAGLNHMSNLGSMDLQIRPDSGQLSGGEIQRVGLARALYRNPGILFLDEATSALDAQTEAEVNEILDRLRGQMTIVLIAHRLSTVKTADKIIYLDKGRVVAEGTFKELQKKVPDFEKAVKLMGLE